MRSQKRITVIILSLIILAIALSACGQSASQDGAGKQNESGAETHTASQDGGNQNSPAAETRTALLYANCVIANADYMKTYEISYTGELTPAILANELTKLTGFYFFAEYRVEDAAVYVDWADNSTLIAGLGDHTQKDDFYFFDAISLRWFMMDTMYRTFKENFGKDVYFT